MIKNQNIGICIGSTTSAESIKNTKMIKLGQRIHNIKSWTMVPMTPVSKIESDNPELKALSKPVSYKIPCPNNIWVKLAWSIKIKNIKNLSILSSDEEYDNKSVDSISIKIKTIDKKIITKLKKDLIFLNAYKTNSTT